MSTLVRLTLVVSVIFAAAAAVASAQPAKFEDVVRSLRNPDPKVRVSAVRLLREAGYSEAIVPIAPLANDPVEAIQLEAIDAELGFFLVEPVPARRKIALIVEVRSSGRSVAAFEAGPLAVWPKAAPAELVDALLTAVDDEDKKVRFDAIYTLGVVAGASSLSEAAVARLIKALDHYDPEVRCGAARVIGRLELKPATDALLKAINDSSAAVRHASMRALGEIRDARAVEALTQQLDYYKQGEGARAAAAALALIAHPSSVPAFQARLADRDPEIRRAAVEGLARTGDAKMVSGFVMTVNQDEAESVRAAMAFALHKNGYPNYLGRMIDFMDHPRSAQQVRGYLVELGPTVIPFIIPRLKEPDEGVREHLAAVLGVLGNQATVPVLTSLKNDPNAAVAAAATHAVERINMTQK
jgi:HEAT repeat protein